MVGFIRRTGLFLLRDDGPFKNSMGLDAVFVPSRRTSPNSSPTDADEKWIPPRDEAKTAPFGTAAQMGIAAIWIQDIVRYEADCSCLYSWISKVERLCR